MQRMHAETLSNLAKWGSLDKGTLSAAMTEAGVEPEKKGKAHLYPIDKAIGVIVACKTNAIKGRNSSDERNLAQAEKLRLETSILRKEHVAVSKGADIIGRYLSLLADLVQGSELSNEARERFIDRFHADWDRLSEQLREEQNETEE